jgi:tetratricopeptide (TPR) repeat protein
MRRTLRLGRAAVVLVAFVILAVCVHFLHAFQLTRNASVLLNQGEQAQKQADEAKNAGDHDKAAEALGKAADYLGRYLGFHPDDADALARYGLLLNELAKSPLQKGRAFFVLEKAVRTDPARDDVRRKLVDLAVSIGRTLDARDHLKTLLEASPDDPELEYQMGRCEEADGHFADAKTDYEDSIHDGPRRVDAYVRLASLLRRRGDNLVAKDGKKGVNRYSDPKEVMEDMVAAAGPQSAEARLARSHYLREAGLYADAVKDVEAAWKLAPEDVEVLLADGDVKMEKGDFKGARTDLEAGKTAHPGEVRLLLSLAALGLREGNPTAAVDQLHAAIEVLSAAHDSDALWSVANLLIDAGKPEEARELIGKLSAGGPSVAADFLKARLDFVDGKFGPCAALLEDRRKQLAASPELARETDRLLGLCYERLGNPDQQLAAFRRAVERDPMWLPGRLGQASALLAVGKFDEALGDYRALVGRAPEARLQAIRLLILRNLRAPGDKRDWKEADALVKDASDDERKTAGFRLVEANLLGAEGRLDDAWKKMDDAVAADPKEVRYRIVQADLADFEERQKKKPPLTARAALDKAEAEAGDGVELRLARAARFAVHPNAVKALKPLEEKADAFNAADRTRLFAGLAEAHIRAGDLDGAVALLGQARDLSKDDLAVRVRLFDLTLRSFGSSAATKSKDERDKQAATLQVIVDDVRGIEGADGVAWRYCEASLLIFQAQNGDKAGLKDARALLAEVGKRRPGWSRPPLLEGEVEELDGDADGAAAKYRQAIDLGDRRPEVLRVTARLLASCRRYDEAKQVLEKVGDAPADGDLGRLDAEVSLLNRDPKEHVQELLERAEKAAADSKDFNDPLWLGQMYLATGDKAKAEAAFRRAVALAAAAPEARVALVVLLAGEGEKDKARAELEKAGAALPADKAAAVLAIGYEALGQRDKAEEQYLSLLKPRPDKSQPDVAALRETAGFYLRGGDVPKATPLLQQIIDAPSQQADAEPVLWARRTLALALAAGGDYAKSKNALDLLDQNLRERKTPEDERARAIVLASRPGGRRDSIRTLEASFNRLRPTPDEEFLLARLYEADRDWDHANEHFLALVGAKGGANPSHLAYYVLALLRRKDANEAAIWLARLEALEPDGARTLGLKARVLHAQGKGEAAGRLVEDYADKTFKEKKNAAVLGEAASLLEELGRPVEAEKKFREYVKAVEAEQPEKTLVLAAFLARQKRLPESLDVIEAIWAKCKPETAALTTVAALRVGGPTDRDYRRAEVLLREEVARNPMTGNLLVALADLRDAEGKDGEAETLYRQILTANPRNALALNNLAWLLAFRPGKSAEALELVNRRIEMTGPSASVLDTRGVVYLKLGRAEDAARDFTDSAAQNPTAVYYFHLAEAQKAAGKANEAEKTSRKAEELGLKEADLHPLEQADYQKWAAQRKGS